MVDRLLKKKEIVNNEIIVLEIIREIGIWSK